jgi:transcription termination factor Rho
MAVLQRKQLESSPLADLHAIASELGLEGFRKKRRDDLIGAILSAQGGAEEEHEPDEVPSDEALEEPPGAAVAAGEPRSDEEAAEIAAARAETLELAGADEAAAEAAPAEGEPAVAVPEEGVAAVAAGETGVSEVAPAGEEEAAVAGEGVSEAAPAGEEDAAVAPAREEEPEVEDEVSDEEITTGVLDILANGSGFLRLDATGQSRDDVYVSPAQIRRCELRAGDDVSGPVRPPRRNERHPSLIRVETVNGADAEPPEQRPWFGELTPVFPRERLSAPAAFDSAPFGKGSRVAVSGAPGAGASRLLLEVARMIAERYPELGLRIVLAGVRPEEVGEWSATGASVAGGSFERSPEAQAQAAELAVERAKRVVERGGHAALVIDALDALPPSHRRRVFGAARATEEGGTLTIVAATGEDRDALRWASTRLVLVGGGQVDAAASGTLRAEELS